MFDAVAESVDVDALAVGAVELAGLALPRRLAAAHARLLRARAVVPVRRVVAEPAFIHSSFIHNSSMNERRTCTR